MNLTCCTARPGRAFAYASILVAVWAYATHAGMPAFRFLESGSPGGRPGMKLLSSDSQSLRMEFTLPSLVIAGDEIDGVLFQALSIPEGGEMGEVGQPGLPVFGRLVAIPDCSDVRVLSTVLEEREYGGFRIKPVQPDDAVSPAHNKGAYAVDSFGDSAAVVSGDPMLIRGLRVVPLTIRPVRYNPARGMIRVAKRIRVEISFDGENLTNVRRGEQRPIPPSFDRIYREMVINYDTFAEGRSIEGGTYLILCPDAPEITSRLQRLVDWRRRSGTRVHLATTAETGTTPERIKSFIQDAYDNWEHPPEYIVLVGDADGPYHIPTFTDRLRMEGDHPYGQLDGDDILLDAHIGRLSIRSTAHLDVIIDKIMGYEKNPHTQDPHWFTSATLVGDPTHSGYSCVQVMQWMKTRLRQLSYTRIDTVFSGNFVGQMGASLNRGSTVFCYRGFYGLSGWRAPQTHLMRNGYRLPFATILTCESGSFARENEAYSEGFLRAGTVGDPRGAIGCIGTAGPHTNTRYNNALTHGIWHAVLYADIREMGAALTMGKLVLYTNYPGQPHAVTGNSHWNSLMGDPAVPVWTAFPEEMLVCHPEQIAVGTNVVSITVQDGPDPVAGAKVCLMKGTETWVVGFTDLSGVVELPVNVTSTGMMQATVTRYDLRPYLADIPVVAPAQYVGLDWFGLDDTTSGEGRGNGDGRLNPGETVELAIRLRNFGSHTVDSVIATLTTDDPYVTLINTSRTYGSIAGGRDAWSDGGYLLSLAPSCPNGHAVRFGLNIVSESDSWRSILEMPVYSAEFEAGTVALYGRGEEGEPGRLDPGRSADLSVLLHNKGSEDATGITASLRTTSPWVSVLNGTGSFPDIAAGGSGTNSVDRFTIQASAKAFSGHEAAFSLITRFNGSMIDTTAFSVIIGLRTYTDPTGPDAYGYYAFDNTDTLYAEAPTYDWIEVDPNYGGMGTEIVLGDYGVHQDKSQTIDLPFIFRFYGETFDRVTVCSNGWLAFGDTYLTDYRNWTIPSPGSPQNLVAVFWDDLYQEGSAGVFQKYDEENNRWVCQWSRMRNRIGGYVNTFQVILYDPVHHPTVSGDGVIDMQYLDVISGDDVDGYATVGIQNWDQTVGLLYTYFNQYTPGSAPLVPGRAIRFICTAAKPDRLTMAPARPNPFSGSTTILFDLPESRRVGLSIVDVGGRVIARLADREFGTGHHRLAWTGLNDAGHAVPSGVYFARMEHGGGVLVRRLVLVR